MLTKKETLKTEVKSSRSTKNSAQPETSPSTQTPAQATAASTPSPAKSYTPQTTKQPYDSPAVAKGNPKTRVTINYDVGFSNKLYIRGAGANLSWDKGQPLTNTKADEWVWETDANFNQCEFKVLINDQAYENGGNHTLKAGATVVYTPYFS